MRQELKQRIIALLKERRVRQLDYKATIPKWGLWLDVSFRDGGYVEYTDEERDNIWVVGREVFETPVYLDGRKVATLIEVWRIEGWVEEAEWEQERYVEWRDGEIDEIPVS